MEQMYCGKINDYLQIQITQHYIENEFGWQD